MLGRKRKTYSKIENVSIESCKICVNHDVHIKVLPFLFRLKLIISFLCITKLFDIKRRRTNVKAGYGPERDKRPACLRTPNPFL